MIPQSLKTWKKLAFKHHLLLSHVFVFQARELEKLTAESQKANESCKDAVESLNGKVSFLNNLLKEKSEVLARIEADKQMLQVMYIWFWFAK